MFAKLIYFEAEGDGFLHHIVTEATAWNKASQHGVASLFLIKTKGISYNPVDRKIDAHALLVKA